MVNVTVVITVVTCATAKRSQRMEPSSPPSKRSRPAAVDWDAARSAARRLPRPKVFNDPVLGHVEIHPCCVAVMDTVEFQRLRSLAQLGPTESVFPGATHRRFAHSIGVSYLGGRFVERLASKQPELRITAADILCVKLAGLCHDLGHGPLSHTYEARAGEGGPRRTFNSSVERSYA